MNEPMASIWLSLSTHHRGHAQAIRAKDLRGDLSNHAFVEAIRTLIIDERKPICSSDKVKPLGYFVATTRQELLDYRTQLIDRLTGVKDRITAIDSMLAAWKDAPPALPPKPVQPALFDTRRRP